MWLIIFQPFMYAGIYRLYVQGWQVTDIKIVHYLESHKKQLVVWNIHSSIYRHADVNLTG